MTSLAHSPSTIADAGLNQPMAWQPVTWLGMSLVVPAAWEILQHARDPKRGKLVFADHRRGRLHMGWAEAKRPPDTERLIEDYRARDLEEDAATQFSSLGVLAGWRGYRRRRGGEVVTRAGRFDDLHMRWIEMTLIWPDGVNRPAERRILDQFAVVDDRQGPSRWRAFGMDFQTPRGLQLRRADVRPGSATMRFSDDRRPGQQAEIRRLSAADAWFDGDAQTLIREQLPRSKWTFEQRFYEGRQVVVGLTVQPDAVWRRLVGRRRDRRDMVWADASGHRVFHVTTISPAARPLEPEVFALRALEFEATLTRGGGDA